MKKTPESNLGGGARSITSLGKFGGNFDEINSSVCVMPANNPSLIVTPTPTLSCRTKNVEKKFSSETWYALVTNTPKFGLQLLPKMKENSYP